VDCLDRGVAESEADAGMMRNSKRLGNDSVERSGHAGFGMGNRENTRSQKMQPQIRSGFGWRNASALRSWHSHRRLQPM